MPPLPPNREFGILEPAAKRLGLHPLHIPMARNSVPYNGRGPCMRCLEPATLYVNVLETRGESRNNH